MQVILKSGLNNADAKQTYYVLHRKPYRENSQIVDLFCEKQGRFSALYRVNKKNPPLQPFTPYQIQFSGRGNLKYCQYVEANYSSLSELKGHFLKGRNLYCGFYLNELIMRLTWQGEPQAELFNVYQQTLQGLLQLDNDQQTEPFLRRFEFHLLSILGYQYNWQQDCECQDIQPEQYYNFDPHAGFKVIHAQAYGIPIPTSRMNINAGFPGDAILAIAADDWGHALSWQVAKQVARLALQPLLGDKPLTSRTLFQRL
jgi:DNA repair protein RecO (recombination protein O)